MLTLSPMTQKQVEVRRSGRAPQQVKLLSIETLGGNLQEVAAPVPRPPRKPREVKYDADGNIIKPPPRTGNKKLGGKGLDIKNDEVTPDPALRELMSPSFPFRDEYKMTRDRAMRDAENTTAESFMRLDKDVGLNRLQGMRAAGIAIYYPARGTWWPAIEGWNAGDPNPTFYKSMLGGSNRMCFYNVLLALCRLSDYSKLTPQMLSDVRAIYAYSLVGQAKAEATDPNILPPRLVEQMATLFLRWPGYWSFTQQGVLFDHAFTQHVKLRRVPEDCMFGSSDEECFACFEWVSSLSTRYAALPEDHDNRKWSDRFTGQLLFDTLGDEREGKLLQAHLDSQLGEDRQEWDAYNGNFKMHHCFGVCLKSGLMFDDLEETVLAFNFENFKKLMRNGVAFVSAICYRNL